MLHLLDLAVESLAFGDFRIAFEAASDHGQRLEVDSGGERPAFAGDDHDPGFGVGPEEVHGPGKVLPHGHVHGVEFVRAIQPDRGDVAVFVDGDDVRREVHGLNGRGFMGPTQGGFLCARVVVGLNCDGNVLHVMRSSAACVRVFCDAPSALFLVDSVHGSTFVPWALLFGVNGRTSELEGDVKRTRLALLLVFGMLAALLPVGVVPAVGQVSPPTLVVNEIDYDQPSTDTAEFVEILNNGVSVVSLDGVQLVLVNGSGGASYQTFALPSVTLPAGGYFVVCGDAANVENCDLDVSPDSNLIQNGAPDAVALMMGSVLVDTVSYEGDTAAPYTEGSGVGLEDDPSVVDLGISRNPNGADTNINNVDFSQRCITPGEANTAENSNCEPPPAAELVINEVDYDQPGTDTAEFVEIFNSGTAAADLSGYSLVLVNGNGGAVYEDFALPSVTLAAGDYFVVCGDAGNVDNCDLDVTPNSNLVQNGAPDAVALMMGTVVVDAVSYEGDTAAPYIEGSGVGLEDDSSVGDLGISRYPDGTDTNANNVDLSQRCITPGEANTAENSNCEPIVVTKVKIHEVQGSGAASPLVGDTVVIEGIVVGDFQDGASGTNGDLNGFHVQEEDADADADPMTSEGIFVFDGSSPAVNVAIGDLVRVEGSVSEFNDLTEITSFSGVTVLSSGNPLPTAATLSLPVTAVDDFEAYEGMYVTFPQALVISEYFNFDRFNEIVLTSQRNLTPTAEVEPGPAAVLEAQKYLLDRITLDDGRTSQNSDPAIHPNGGVFDLTNLFRGGDTVENVTGVMDYAFNLYRIQPTQGADYTNANPRTAAPDPVGGSLQVATFNVLNYFTTLDNGGPICGPLGDQDCRGADDAGEFIRQRDKIIAALATIDADVVGLTEIENAPDNTPEADLVAGLNAATAPGTYDFIAAGPIGGDAIRVAFIYKPASVTPAGAFAVLDSTVDSRFNDDKNRPVLAQTFMQNATGELVTVAVNHLKSKGSSCDDVGDPNTGDGAGNCNLTRKAAAAALVDWLAGDPTRSGDPDYLIIGDLNSYDKEDPIDVLKAGGYEDLIYNFLGENAYSYVFDGQIGYLDYGMANPSLMAQVTGTTVWHINADEPDLIDYDTSFKKDAQDAIYAPDAYRSSDHDPVIVGLNLDQTAPDVHAEFDKIWAGYYTGLFKVDYSCTDNVDPDPTCVGDINGISVKDGQKVFLITSRRSWDRRIGKILYIAAPTFVLTVESSDSAGNTAEATDKPEFRTRWWWN